MRNMLQAFCLLLGVLVVTVASADVGATLSGDEREKYIEEIKLLQATDDETAALLMQLNYLLQEHALLAGYQVGQAQPRDYLYEASIGEPGLLLIRQQVRNEKRNELRGNSERLPVFGISPFFSYDCTINRYECQISHAESQTQLFRIVRQPDAAAELTRVLSFLVRSMQREAQSSVLSQ